MIQPKDLKDQLRSINADYRFWGRAELRELPNILFEGERVQHVVNGRYEGGFAMLCATDQRVLLIDKKPFYMTSQDIRYDMVSDVTFNRRLLDAALHLGTINSSIHFIAYNQLRMQRMTNYIQQKVMEFRRQQAPYREIEQVEASSPVPLTQATLEKVMTPTQTQGTNPYKMPVMIRRRVSRFY